MRGSRLVPSESPRANVFVCEQCCFEAGIQFADLSIKTAIALVDSQVNGILFLSNTEFEQPLTLKRLLMTGGLQAFNVRLRSGADFSESTFMGQLRRAWT